MSKVLWVFPAILCILLSITFSTGFHFIGLLMCLLWMFRVVLLKQSKILLCTLFVGLCFTTSLFTLRRIEGSNLIGHETSFFVYPDLTSLNVDGDRIRFEGLVQTNDYQEKIIVTYKVSTETEKELWLHNPPMSYIHVTGALNLPSQQRNFHQFDYQSYLKQQSIYWELQADRIEVLSKSTIQKPLRAYISTYRHRLFTAINNCFSPKIASYIRMLLFSDRRYFSEEVLQSYRDIGIVHLFSISGFHISYLIQMIRKIMFRFGFTHETTDWLIILLLPLYSALAGFGVGVFRAVTQNIMLLGCKKLNQNIDTIDAWSISVMAILLLNPYRVLQLSFQLSYLLSFVFILFSKQKWTREQSSIKTALLFSAIASLVSLPILTYHFFEIPWVSVFANSLFIPFFSIVLFPSILGLFLSSYFIGSTNFFYFIEHILLLMIEFVEKFTSLLTNYVNFSFVTGRLPWVMMFLLIIAIFSIVRKLEKKNKPSIGAIILLITCLCFNRISPVGYVLMLDIGQGDLIVIKEPLTGKITLIDTGGQLRWSTKVEPWKEREHPFLIGTDVTVPALKSLGISQIDRLYITHADADHSGEIKAIAEQIPIREIATTEVTFKDKSIFEQIKSQKKMKRTIVSAPEVLKLPTENTLALHPKSGTYSKNNNNQSLVLYVTLGKDNWLFTGDIEKEAELNLLTEYQNIKVDYLKVSHHGSKTSTTEDFIKQLKPSNALISAGVNNQFGHPHQEVVQRLEKYDVSIYSTNETGAIMVRYFKIPFMDKWLTDLQTVHKNR